MVAFVIFWAAVFALLFFLLSVIFKALASVFNYAIPAAVAGMIPIIVVFSLPMLAVIAIRILYAIVSVIIEKGFWSVVGSIVLFLIVIGIFWVIFGIFGVAALGLLQVILQLAVIAAVIITEYVSVGLEWLADRCERGYKKFLNVIKKRIDMC